MRKLTTENEVSGRWLRGRDMREGEVCVWECGCEDPRVARYV